MLHFSGCVLIQSPNKLGGTAFMVLGLKGPRERMAEREERAAVRKEQSRASCPGSHPAGVLPGQLALAARQSPRPYNRSSPCKNTMGLSQPHPIPALSETKTLLMTKKHSKVKVQLQLI